VSAITTASILFHETIVEEEYEKNVDVNFVALRRRVQFLQECGRDVGWHQWNVHARDMVDHGNCAVRLGVRIGCSCELPGSLCLKPLQRLEPGGYVLRGRTGLFYRKQ
jgi:hypothetical protein